MTTLLAALSVAAMVFVFWANWIPQHSANGVFPALTSPYDVLPYVFLGWVALSALWYAPPRRRALGAGATAMSGGATTTSRCIRSPVKASMKGTVPDLVGDLLDAADEHERPLQQLVHPRDRPVPVRQSNWSHTTETSME